MCGRKVSINDEYKRSDAYIMCFEAENASKSGHGFLPLDSSDKFVHMKCKWLLITTGWSKDWMVVYNQYCCCYKCTCF